LGSEKHGKEVRIAVELMIWGSWTEITTITYVAILKIKPASQIPEEHRKEKPKHGYPRPNKRTTNTHKKQENNLVKSIGL